MTSAADAGFHYGPSSTAPVLHPCWQPAEGGEVMIAQPTFRVFLCAVFVLVVAESDLRAQRGHHHTNPPYVNWNYRTPFGYQFYSGNPYRYLYGYPSSYAYIASPSRFDVRTYYGSPASYYGYPYFYSVSPSGLGS